MHATTYGLDVAKRVFQMYWVDGDTGEIVNRRFGRDDLIQYLSRRPPGRVALEACGSAHWWARKIKALGHDQQFLRNWEFYLGICAATFEVARTDVVQVELVNA